VPRVIVTEGLRSIQNVAASPWHESIRKRPTASLKASNSD
jgi:hypothetical protein